MWHAGEALPGRGRDGLDWWTHARPAGGEALQIFDIGRITRETSSRVYIPHVSSEERGIRSSISGPAARVQYLLSNIAWEFGALAMINLLLRRAEDAAWMWGRPSRGAWG